MPPFLSQDQVEQPSVQACKTVPACVGTDLCDKQAFAVWMAHINLHCAQSAGNETPLHELCAQELDQKLVQVPVVADKDCYGKPLGV